MDEAAAGILQGSQLSIGTAKTQQCHCRFLGAPAFSMGTPFFL